MTPRRDRHHDQVDQQAVDSTTPVADERAGTVVPGPQSATQGQRRTAPTAGRVAAPWMRPAARRTALAVRAVVFDVGGVLEHAIDTNLDGRWEQRLGLAAGEFLARLRRSGLGQDANLGGISAATHLPLARRPPRRGGLPGRHRGERGGGPRGRDARGAVPAHDPSNHRGRCVPFGCGWLSLTADGATG